MDSIGVSSSAYNSSKSQKIDVKKPHSSSKELEASDQIPWISKTPEKLSNPSRRQIQKPNTSESLPEKYELLDKFFNSLDSSIRLLGLKRSKPTFTNISSMVERLTDRRFSYSHLAQLKYILPEGIEIKKILVRDDRTSCMKPDLHVTLNFSVIQNNEDVKLDSLNLRMRKLFRSRLVSFHNSNLEVDEVPEEILPEPFNQSTRVAIEKPNMGSIQNTTSTVFEPNSSVASHIPQSFRRFFSKQPPTHNLVDQEAQEVLPISKQESEPTFVSKAVSPVKLSAKLPETPIKSFDSGEKDDLSTPAKLISTPFSATPAQTSRPPVRCLMTPDEEDSRMLSPSKLMRRSSGRRSITFDTPVKKNSVKRVSNVDDILSEDLVESIKEKERKSLEENDPAISEAKWRKQMIAGLPRLFDILLFFFQSIKRTVVTKQDLMHTIISNNLDIGDPKKVDEQLRLLQELAPEWIYEKMSSSGGGDLLFCVNKISNPESIRTRLSEAN